MKKLSENFETAFRGNGGGCVRQCKCGTTFFDDSLDGGWDWDEGEREELRRLAISEPAKVKALDYTVATIAFEGHEYVPECECTSRALRPYEDFIERNAWQIAEYLNLRAKEILYNAESEFKNTTVEIPHD